MNVILLSDMQSKIDTFFIIYVCGSDIDGRTFCIYGWDYLFRKSSLGIWVVQKCITEYQIGAAKVTRAEVDMWIKEAENADRVRGNKEKRYEAHIDFYMIQIREAHASDVRPIGNIINVKEHCNLSDCLDAAREMVKITWLEIPVLADTMDDTFLKLYAP
ncbi:hypothetical protein RhiirA4_475633 [Rhizophagus irregularis]|uniref:Uncharacterized protein n=1 Tax=Rhizophagus irregularis TaxID=588596 RepID=A0A2I1HAD8_9GLOM|nr:hypothetical protein RhiirA4_475633 [Rhizophagus irregularis]